ncbi:hypothetical protein RND71_025923 [Anisodus tanguticus]|uniref:Uncharacterized protein n=1 Tax=Anisodus tanguticus TaxID=243964 RepID=A0AAE1RJU5_9SOLA|nr:hypothetical protein RND71_025923 [Anisodus tanguticus]
MVVPHNNHLALSRAVAMVAPDNNHLVKVGLREYCHLILALPMEKYYLHNKNHN